MRRLLLFLLLCGCANAQYYNANLGGISYSSGASVPGSCSPNGSWFFYQTSSTWYQCISGTWTSTGGGSGTVTVVGAGNLTSTAFVSGGGTQTLQTPSATSTLDSSGNASFAGTLAAGATTITALTSNGTATGNLTSSNVIQDTNSTNSNTNIGLLAGAAGTSTGGLGLVVFDVSGTGDLARFYTGGSVSAGVYTIGTLEASITNAGQLNLGGNTVTAGTGGGLDATEGTAPTAQASHEQCYADSTNHQMECSVDNFANAASVKFFPLQVNAINTQTATYPMVAQDSTILCNKASAMTVTLLASGIPSGKTVRVKNIGAGACTVTPASGNIDNQTTLILNQYAATDFIWDGTQWWAF